MELKKPIFNWDQFDFISKADKEKLITAEDFSHSDDCSAWGAVEIIEILGVTNKLAQRLKKRKK